MDPYERGDGAVAMAGLVVVGRLPGVTVSSSAISQFASSVVWSASARGSMKPTAVAFLDVPILGTQCNPVAGGNANDLDATTGKYDCLAYVKSDGGQLSG